jgi:hypothetical protein
VPLGTFNGLPLGGGAPPLQALSCSLGSGYLYLQVGFAQTAAVAFDASPAELALALENLGVVASVGVVALPRLVGGLHLTPRAICSADAASPVVTQLTFHGWGGALAALGLSASEQSGSEAGSAAVRVLQQGSLPSYGAGAGGGGGGATWDAAMLHGCHCDGYPDWNASGADLGAGAVDRGRWWGSACALRACPVGAVPLAPQGVAAEAQALACAGATGGTFTLAFRGQVSAPISFDAPPWEVQAALQALPSVGLVGVRAADGSAGVCGGGAGSAPGNTFTVAFQTLLGALPLLVADGALLQGPAGGVALSVARETAGAGLLKECSGHGVCDTSAGLCACLPGYASSNGALAAGSRGDCGISRGAGGG